MSSFTGGPARKIKKKFIIFRAPVSRVKIKIFRALAAAGIKNQFPAPLTPSLDVVEIIRRVEPFSPAQMQDKAENRHDQISDGEGGGDIHAKLRTVNEAEDA